MRKLKIILLLLILTVLLIYNFPEIYKELETQNTMCIVFLIGATGLLFFFEKRLLKNRRFRIKFFSLFKRKVRNFIINHFFELKMIIYTIILSITLYFIPKGNSGISNLGGIGIAVLQGLSIYMLKKQQVD